MVQDGEVTFTVKGQLPRLLKVGDSVHIPRGTVHRNQNLSDKPSRAIEVLIVDKDEPQSEKVLCYEPRKHSSGLNRDLLVSSFRMEG